MIDNYLAFWTKAFVFTGKATRLQYFIPWIINTIIFETYCFATNQWRTGLLLQPIKFHLGDYPGLNLAQFPTFVNFYIDSVCFSR